jgi:restriction system protein
MKVARGPEFIRYFIPILEVLRVMGGSGSANEVTDAVVELLKIPEKEQLVANKNGGSRVRNRPLRRILTTSSEVSCTGRATLRPQSR